MTAGESGGFGRPYLTTRRRDSKALLASARDGIGPKDADDHAYWMLEVQPLRRKAD